MAGFHARLAPSSAKMWIACAASAAGDDYEGDDEETVYAKEGTAAHEVGCRALTEGKEAADFIGSIAYGLEVTEEMAEAVQKYVDLCWSEAAYTTPDGVEVIYELHAEDRITLDPLNPPERVWGTTDCWVLKTHVQTLTVIDYKHGIGIVVDAEENDQGRCYALGVLVKLMQQMPEQARHIKWIEVVICQPRAYHPGGPVRRERIRVDELIAWYRTRLLPAIIRTLEPDPEFHAGDHCRFCRRAGRCKTREQYELRNAALLFQEGDRDTALVTTPPEAKYLSPVEIARVLDAAPMLRDWLNAVEKYALKSNLTIPGRKRVETVGHRAWTDPSTIAPLLVTLFSLSEEDVVEHTVRSPYQIEKLLTKAKKAALANFYHRPPRGIALVPEDDVKPAVDAGVRVARLFQASDDNVTS